MRFLQEKYFTGFCYCFHISLRLGLWVPKTCNVRTQQIKVREKEAALSLDRLIKAQ